MPEQNRSKEVEPPPIAVPTPMEPPSSGYQFVADKVGFVPNMRKSDNKFQAKFTFATAFLVAIAFEFMPWFGPNEPWFLRMGLGFFAGLLGGLLLSGTYLAILNLRRPS